MQQQRFSDCLNTCLRGFIDSHDAQIGQNENRLSVMLTGGSTARSVYEQAWIRSASDSKVVYYMGDERAVSPAHPDSNYGLVMSTLFRDGLPKGSKLFRMRGEAVDLPNEALRYSMLLPSSIDILLLSVGPDGHIASLFPGGAALNEMHTSVLAVVAPKPPPQRLTITPKVILSAKNVIVMAYGEQKGRVLAEAFNCPQAVADLPVRLAIGGTWILDAAAAKAFKSFSKHTDYLGTRFLYA